MTQEPPAYGSLPPGPPPGPPSTPPPPGPPPASPYGAPPPPSGGTTGRGWIVALVTGIVALVAVIVVGLVLVLGDDDGSDKGSRSKGGSDEEQIEQVITDAMTRWGEAEGGDAGACDGLDELIEGHGEDVEAQCKEEVGSHTDSEMQSIEVKDIELDGDEGTAQVTINATGDDGEDNGFTREMKVVKVDDRWKVSFE